MDREKVIKYLEECITASCRGYRPRLLCPYNDEEWDIMRDALAILKEQEGTINELQNAYDYLQKQFLEVQDKLLKEQPEIVRCKDCMYNSISDDESIGQCLIQYGWFPARPDWFCADGKKRNDDDD